MAAIDHGEIEVFGDGGPIDFVQAATGQRRYVFTRTEEGIWRWTYACEIDSAVFIYDTSGALGVVVPPEAATVLDRVAKEP